MPVWDETVPLTPANLDSPGLYVVYRRATVQSIPNNTHTEVLFNDRVVAVGDWDTISVESVNFAIPESGVYELGVSASLEKSGAVDGYFQATVTVNNLSVTADAPLRVGESFGGYQGAEANASGVSRPLSLNANDLVRLFIFQNTGSALDLSANGSSPYLWMRRLGAQAV